MSTAPPVTRLSISPSSVERCSHVTPRPRPARRYCRHHTICRHHEKSPADRAVHVASDLRDRAFTWPGTALGETAEERTFRVLVSRPGRGGGFDRVLTPVRVCRASPKPRAFDFSIMTGHDEF